MEIERTQSARAETTRGAIYERASLSRGAAVQANLGRRARAACERSCHLPTSLGWLRAAIFFLGRALRVPLELHRFATVMARRLDGPLDCVAFDFAVILHHILLAAEI